MREAADEQITGGKWERGKRGRGEAGRVTDSRGKGRPVSREKLEGGR